MSNTIMSKTRNGQVLTASIVSAAKKTVGICTTLLALSCAAPQAEPRRGLPPAQTQEAPLSREQEVKKLIKDLDDKDSQVQLNAISDLGLMKEVRAVPFLIGILKGSNRTLKMTAAAALGYIKDKSALPSLRETAENDKNKFTQAAAADAYLYISGKTDEMHFRLIPSAQHRGVTIQLADPAD